MKDGQSTKLDQQVSETIFYICKVERARYDAYHAWGDIHCASKALWEIPDLPREQREEWQHKLGEINDTLREFILFLNKQANRLEWQNIISLEISKPKDKRKEAPDQWIGLYGGEEE